jgi:hypothetical protein
MNVSCDVNNIKLIRDQVQTRGFVLAEFNLRTLISLRLLSDIKITEPQITAGNAFTFSVGSPVIRGLFKKFCPIFFSQNIFIQNGEIL